MIHDIQRIMNMTIYFSVRPTLVGQKFRYVNEPPSWAGFWGEQMNRLNEEHDNAWNLLAQQHQHEVGDQFLDQHAADIGALLYKQQQQRDNLERQQVWEPLNVIVTGTR